MNSVDVQSVREKETTGSGFGDVESSEAVALGRVGLDVRALALAAAALVSSCAEDAPSPAEEFEGAPESAENAEYGLHQLLGEGNIEVLDLNGETYFKGRLPERTAEGVEIAPLNLIFIGLDEDGEIVSQSRPGDHILNPGEEFELALGFEPDEASIRVTAVGLAGEYRIWKTTPSTRVEVPGF